MTNHPRVKLSSLNHSNYDVILDMTISYQDVLQERLRLLENFVVNIANDSLEKATTLINEAGVSCTSKEVNKVIFGAKGMVPSTLASLNGTNTNRPTNYSGALTRKDGSPIFVDQYGKEFVRGVIVGGHYPYKEAKNTLTAIRNCLEVNLNLPRYIRHELVSGDETVDRDENNNPQ